MLLAGLVACNTGDVQGGGADATEPDDSSSDVASFSFGDAPYVYDVTPGYPEPLPPPSVSCVDAGDAGSVCPLPRSICDQSLLEYFDNGVCVDGGCRFDSHLTSCGGSTSCVDGGCVGFVPTHAP